jgi:hypothetical protein
VDGRLVVAGAVVVVEGVVAVAAVPTVITTITIRNIVETFVNIVTNVIPIFSESNLQRTGNSSIQNIAVNSF